jgi:hypothetical protein
MNARRTTAYVAIPFGILVGLMSAQAWSQQKYQIARSPSSSAQYVQQHAIDVDDAPGHQIRVYEIRYEYPKKDFAFAGVQVLQTLTRGISDYVGLSGPFTTYTVYTLEDGNKVFSRGTGTSMLTAGASGNSVVKFSAVENYLGGTGCFKGIRGQVLISGERDVVAKSLTQQSNGEYWIEE